MDNISQKMSFYENVGRPQLARNCQVSEQLWIPKIRGFRFRKKVIHKFISINVELIAEQKCPLCMRILVQGKEKRLTLDQGCNWSDYFGESR